MDYKFRGDAEDSEKWRYMEETVLNQALAKEGFKMNWLYEKREPDKKIYENDKGIMSRTNKIKYQAKLEEIEAKELKVFGILQEHIEPASRAFSLIGLENLMKGDPDDVRHSQEKLQQHQNSGRFVRGNRKIQ